MICSKSIEHRSFCDKYSIGPILYKRLIYNNRITNQILISPSDSCYEHNNSLQEGQNRGDEQMNEPVVLAVWNSWQ